MIKVHFLAPARDAGRTTIVEGRAGQSLMDAAVAACLDGIDAECGGTLTCATCHVYVLDAAGHGLPPPADDESEMLGFTAAPRLAESRLSCQIVLTAAMNGLVVQLPERQQG